MYSETCINRSRSKAETLLRRTDTFDPVCFLYAFLPLISKAKTVKRTLLQTSNFFQSSNKKATCHMQTNKNFRNFRETKNQIGHFCQTSQKETFFYTLKQQFSISFCSFEGVRYFWVELCIIFSKLLSATDQQLFCVTESDIWQGPSNHTPPLYELLVSVLWLTLSFDEVSKTCRRMH